MEVGTLIFLVVDGFDGDSPHGDFLIAGLDEHVHLILEPVTGHGQHEVRQAPGKSPQACLGIRQPLTIEQLEHAAGHAVAEPGFGRHVGIVFGKIPAAKQQFFLLTQLRRQLQGIRHGVLPVGISGDHTLELGMLFQVSKAGAQRGAFSPVHLMVQHMAAFPPSDLVKEFLVFRAGPVVHHQDQSEIRRQQLLHIGGQAVVRGQGGNQHAAFLWFHLSAPLFQFKVLSFKHLGVT